MTFADELGVSRETAARLEAFENLVLKWTQHINLVSRRDALDLRHRHLLDSAQVFGLAGLDQGRWVDIGSGAGFPALVVAIMAAEQTPALEVVCIESDARKAAFLVNAARELALPRVRVLAERAESAHPQTADVVSARALAELRDLLPLARRHLRPGGVAIFPKGARYATEIAAARECWTFDVDVIASKTDPEARILKVEGLSDE